MGLLAAWAAIVLYAGAAPRAYDDARAAASHEAVGEVVRVDQRPDSVFVDVDWAEGETGRHTTRFRLDAEAPAEGEPFPVRYDPADPPGAVFPADDALVAEAHTGARQAQVLAGAAALLGIAVWLARWLQVQGALRTEPIRMRASAMLGSRGPLAVPMVALTPLDPGASDDPSDGAASTDPSDGAASDGSRTRWQQVMWDPALESLEPEAEVLVHGDLTARAPVVVETEDGARLWPAGRLRPAPSRLWRLRARPEPGRAEAREIRALALAGDVESSDAYEAMLREDFALVDDEPVDLTDEEFEIVPRPRRRDTAKRLLLAGALPGAGLGWLASGLGGGAAFATVSGALALFVWAAAGGDPEA